MRLSTRTHSIEVRKTARVLTLGGDGGVVEDVWFVLHGYRQSAERFLRRFERVAGPGRLVVAPEALNRFYVDPGEGRHTRRHRVGATWMTWDARDDEIRDYVRYLDRVAEWVGDEWAPDPRRRLALGFSQGVHTACRWVAQGAAQPPHDLVLWGAYVPPDLDMDRAADQLGETRITHVYGAEDPTRDPGLRASQDSRLSGAGLRTRTLHHPGGHRLDGSLLERFAEEGAG